MAQIDEGSVKKHEFNKNLYNALMGGDEEKVISLCRDIEEGPLHILTIHEDTVLHMATYSKQKDLVLKLLKLLPSDDTFLKLSDFKNDIGNTVLHEAATSDRIVPAAIEMLRICPGLLDMNNVRGETALFRAACYGKIRMFEFLDHQVTKFVESNHGDYHVFHRRSDNTTILHISILSEHFDLALLIVKKYEYLAGEKDGDGMTALQLLACNSSAFQSGSKKISLKKLFYSYTSKQSLNLAVSAEDSTAQAEVETCCRVPLWEVIQSKKLRYNSALQLAKFLIERDNSWENTESAIDESKPKTHKYGGPSTSSPEHAPTATGSEIIPKENAETPLNLAKTPLILATKFGCNEIVEEILQKYPQAVEHVDDQGSNILHVAIKYHRLEIIDIVEKMEVPMRRLVRKIDNNGNSILHMVGLKPQDDEEDMRSPVLCLQELLLLFERVQNISTAHFIKHYNSERQTAEKLLVKSSAQLRNNAKEWLKRTAENCSIVAVLIATVAFAAAYTIPGGPNQNTGYPILLNKPFFVIFTMADVLSLAFALTSVITFLSILTSPFRLRDFKQSLPQKLMLGVTLLIFSVAMMMIAFAATVILMIRNKQQWTKIALSSVAFLPVTIFAFSYLPLYTSLMETFMYSLKKIEPAFPRCNRDHRYHSWLANRFNFNRFKATKDPNYTRSEAILNL